VDGIRNRDVSRLQDLLVQLLLLQLLQLVLQRCLVQRLAQLVIRNSVDDLLAESVLVAELVPVVWKMAASINSTTDQSEHFIFATYIVSSTFSGVSLPWICCMASLAFSMAARVSLLMLADSIALICCSRVPI
jgi:hypothetical protein